MVYIEVYIYIYKLLFCLLLIAIIAINRIASITIIITERERDRCIEVY